MQKETLHYAGNKLVMLLSVPWGLKEGETNTYYTCTSSDTLYIYEEGEQRYVLSALSAPPNVAECTGMHMDNFKKAIEEAFQ